MAVSTELTTIRKREADRGRFGGARRQEKNGKTDGEARSPKGKGGEKKLILDFQLTRSTRALLIGLLDIFRSK